MSRIILSNFRQCNQSWQDILNELRNFQILYNFMAVNVTINRRQLFYIL